MWRLIKLKGWMTKLLYHSRRYCRFLMNPFQLELNNGTLKTIVFTWTFSLLSIIFKISEISCSIIAGRHVNLSVSTIPIQQIDRTTTNPSDLLQIDKSIRFTTNRSDSLQIDPIHYKSIRFTTNDPNHYDPNHYKSSRFTTNRSDSLQIDPIHTNRSDSLQIDPKSQPFFWGRRRRRPWPAVHGRCSSSCSATSY